MSIHTSTYLVPREEEEEEKRIKPYLEAFQKYTFKNFTPDESALRRRRRRRKYNLEKRESFISYRSRASSSVFLFVSGILI